MRLPMVVVLILASAGSVAAAEFVSDLDRCLAGKNLPRAVRFVAPGGRTIYGRVEEVESGIPTSIVPLLSTETPLAEVVRRVGKVDPSIDLPPLKLSAKKSAARICSPAPIPQSAIDSEERVIVAAGLNYAAHAEEAGGGDIFLFPKPVEPTRPYGPVVRHADVTLLDYEVELAFVLLEDVDLRALPTRKEFLARSAFFVTNEISDREPIIREAALSGPGTGFVKGKGRAGFLPSGPWMVRGTELFAALEACGADGLGLRLEVDEGDGFRIRQQASTAAMILDPMDLLAALAAELESAGLRTSMPVLREGEQYFYPMAVGEEAPRLPAGSVILTGTPEGVAVATPDPIALTLRGILRLQSPFAQFLAEEKARAEAAEPGGYLAPGDRVRASIDGLGSQVVEIVDAKATRGPDLCTTQ